MKVTAILLAPVRAILSLPLLIGFYLVGRAHLRAEAKRRAAERRP